MRGYIATRLPIGFKQAVEDRSKEMDCSQSEYLRTLIIKDLFKIKRSND